MFPLEVITMLASFAMTLFSTFLQNKAKEKEIMLSRLEVEQKGVQQAREHNAPGIALTRKTIALLVVGFVVCLPKLAAIFGVPVIVGWTELDPGFWPFVDDVTLVKWRTGNGLFLTPLDTHTMAAVIGFYFGSPSGRRF